MRKTREVTKLIEEVIDYIREKEHAAPTMCNLAGVVTALRWVLGDVVDPLKKAKAIETKVQKRIDRCSTTK